MTTVGLAVRLVISLVMMTCNQKCAPSRVPINSSKVKVRALQDIKKQKRIPMIFRMCLWGPQVPRACVLIMWGLQYQKLTPSLLRIQATALVQWEPLICQRMGKIHQSRYLYTTNNIKCSSRETCRCILEEEKTKCLVISISSKGDIVGGNSLNVWSVGVTKVPSATVSTLITTVNGVGLEE